MHLITAIYPNRRSPPLSGWRKFIQFAKSYAKIIDSRESTYRLALDLTAFDIPTLAAEAFRGIWKFLEAAWEAGIGSFMVFAAPHITTSVAKIASKFTLSPEEQKNAENYLRFHMEELTSTTAMEEAINRINREEPKDQRRVATLYKEIGKEKKAKYYEERAKGIVRFCHDLKGKCTDELREKIYKLKRAVILGESLIEGGVWGSFGLSLRWFRKYILRKDRFTGTMGYLSDSESNKVGEGSKLNLLQKVLGTAAIFLSPVLNTILLKKVRNTETGKKGGFLKTIDEHLDMTHGIYPKLGLLFTYTSIPKWLSTFITAQGWYERLERIFKFCTIIPSWWLGHRVTNGILAKIADWYLARKYNVARGILLTPEYLKPKETKGLSFTQRLKYWCPEPGKTHHIQETIETREEEALKQAGSSTKQQQRIRQRFTALRQKAEDLHAVTLYAGFALHSFFVWCVSMLVNWTTKLRVKHALGK